MPSDSVDVAILGAGIAGCSLSYHLARRGVGPVLVFDPQTLAAGASGRAAGIVTEQLWNRWDVEVTRAAKAEYAELARRWDPSAYATNGFARWTRQAEAVAVLDRVVPQFRTWGVPIERLDADALSRRVPWGRFDDVRGAIWSPDDGVVAPSTMTEIYAKRAQADGVEYWMGDPFHALDRAGDGWSISGRGRTVRARRVVLAAGAWTKRLLTRLGLPAPLAPYRVQAALLRPPRPDPRLFPSVHDIDTDVYARPEANGRILAGDGTELNEIDPETFRPGGDESFVAHLAESFQTRFPGWADAELIRAWAGVVVSTPDRRALVGPVSAAPGLYLMTGFNGFGVMRAGGVAQRLADAMSVGEATAAATEPLAPVLPDRFAGGFAPFSPRPGFTLEGGSDPRF